jgi:hypothetical protein
MPQIIVTADHRSDGEGAVMLRERINPSDFESPHFAAHWSNASAGPWRTHRRPSWTRPSPPTGESASRPRAGPRDPACTNGARRVS